MAGMLRDTAPERERRYYQLLAAMSPAARLRRAVSLSRMVRRLALAGLRARHPHADDRELRTRLAVTLYGRPTAQRIFGPIPDDAR